MKYNGDALDEAYDWFTASLGEALGSSGDPVEVGMDEWDGALHGSGVFFDYLYDQSLASLANWLGVEISSDASLHTARRLCLAIEDGAVSLYYIRAVDGKAYRCETALNSGTSRVPPRRICPNGAQFAFEAGEGYDSFDPYYAVLQTLDTAGGADSGKPAFDG